MHLVCAINFPNFPKFVILTLEKNFATPYLCCLYYYFFHSFYRISACDRARVQDDPYQPSNSLQKIVFMLFITMSSVFDLRCDIDIILLFNFMKNSVNSCRALQIFTVMMQVLLVLFFRTIL